ncbi:thiamine-monophosphate kinase [Sphingomonas kaistensis]|uniref:Thiamine-monophosphate kinase n=1 Tax=Sphingomonas kaistensis TaxID=298708 RepID=A0A7X6BF50_9SPHN|nr:thiamine-phosphate kinase [Sphingomonas kaistensis]NJC05019.1 thiamine-monophosphate kinase [Sphingomonas kaistensis]
MADDVAVLGDLVLTHDTIVEGVHYLPTDPPESVGWKLGAVNLSDLAAKGSVPAGALLSLTLRGDDQWEERFLSGLEQILEHFGLPLLGGDTVALPAGAPRVLGLTVLGKAGGPVPSRSGGRPGDKLWLAGPVGDSAAGLAQLTADPKATGLLVDTYRRPIPLLTIGALLAPHASAMMDVSDGLLLDARRLATASGCGLRVDLGTLPLSPAFRAARGEDRAARLFAATGGDDYALLAALPPDVDPLTILKGTEVNIVVVGELTGGGAFVLADDLGPVPLPERLGYEHDLP